MPGVTLNTVGTYQRNHETQKIPGEDIRLAAEQGDHEAQFILGVMYLNGPPLSKDPEKALKYFKLSADQGNSKASLCTSWMYLKGQGAPKDDQMALHYLEQNIKQTLLETTVPGSKL